MVKIKKLTEQVGTIDIRKFMQQYYGITHNDISRMTHDVASAFFPNIKRTSFGHIDKYPELVRCGRVVFVKDTASNIAPYIVPDTAELAENPQFDIGVLIERVISSIQITSKLSESAVIVIEGEDSLDELVKKESTPNDTKELPRTLIEVTREDDIDGVVISSEGDVSKLKLQDYSLEELSSKTDSVAIVLEEDKSITFIVGGYTQTDLDLIMLRTGLYYCLEYFYEVDEEEILLEMPSKAEIAGLSDYQLIKLMQDYKHNRQLNYYYVMRKELKRRKNKTRGKEKKRNKQKIKRYREEE